MKTLIQQALETKADQIDIYDGTAYFMKGGADLAEQKSDFWMDGVNFFDGNGDQISKDEYQALRLHGNIVASADTEEYGDQMTILIHNNR